MHPLEFESTDKASINRPPQASAAQRCGVSTSLAGSLLLRFRGGAGRSSVEARQLLLDLLERPWLCLHTHNITITIGTGDDPIELN